MVKVTTSSKRDCVDGAFEPHTHSNLAEGTCWREMPLIPATEMMHLMELEAVDSFIVLMKHRNVETEDHVQRVGLYSELIARKHGLAEEFSHAIGLASPLHDIGKVGIPDAILLKPLRLDDHEMQIMRQHAKIGAEILGKFQSRIMQLAAEISLTHHEWWNGEGYPEGRIEEAIPISGRIVAIADVFDALTSARPYKKPWSMEKAIHYVNERAGTQFDPACVDAFNASLYGIANIVEGRFHPLRACES